MKLMRRVGIAIATALSAVTMTGCIQSFDEMRREQEEAWILRVLAVTDDVTPDIRKATAAAEGAATAGDIPALAAAYGDYAEQLRPALQRFRNIETPAACRGEQRAIVNLVRETTSSAAMLSNPSNLTRSRARPILADLDRATRQLDQAFRGLVRRERC